MRRGFVDFKVLSYKRELLQDYSGFNIRIMIDEGSPFKISNINIAVLWLLSSDLSFFIAIEQ